MSTARPVAPSRDLPMLRISAALALTLALELTGPAQAQELFGSGCAGASGVMPTLATNGAVKQGQNWTLEMRAPGGLGLGYLLIGFSRSTSTVFGGAALPLDLGALFSDPLWSGCALNVDPGYTIQPYTFDPNVNGGLRTFSLPGWDVGLVYMQVVNLDPDFATRIAGVSRGLKVVPTPPVGMVSIEPGTFQMGSNAPSSFPYWDGDDENIVHTVTLTRPFWMGRTEVTQSQYESLMGSNPSVFVHPNRPVTTLTWSMARAYCTALTVQETLAGNVPDGYEYRLPTEAEWEYACRAGTTTEFNTGPDLFCSDARVKYTYHPGPDLEECAGATLPNFAGSYAPNAWGLYDMHGNVFEWCLDSYADYSPAPATDPFVTGGSDRIIRGGCWICDSNECRSAYRFGLNAANPPGNLVGFRVVLGPIRVP
jgi:formylglycine-generating enzyme required for sulfatase activity